MFNSQLSQQEAFDKIERMCISTGLNPRSLQNNSREVFNVLEQMAPSEEISIEFIKSVMMRSKVLARRAAAAILGFKRSDESLELLMDLLEDSDIETKLQALNSIVLLNLQECPEQVESLLYDADPYIRWQAVVTLSSFNDPTHFKTLLEKLSDNDDTVVEEVVNALSVYTKPPSEVKILYLIFSLWLNRVPYALKNRLLEWVANIELDIQIKVDQLIKAIQNSLTTQHDIEGKIIHAIARDATGKTKIKDVSEGILDEVSSKDYDARTLGILAILFKELYGPGKIGQEIAINIVKDKRDDGSGLAQREIIDRYNLFIRFLGPWEKRILIQNVGLDLL